MATLREKVAGGPLGKKSPMRIIVGTPSTEKPIGPEGKTLTPAQHPPPAKYVGPTAAERMAKTAADRAKISKYWADRNAAANAKMGGK